MFEYLNRRISTLVSVVIIIVVAIIAFGGFFAYKYYFNKGIVSSEQSNLTINQIDNAQVLLSSRLVQLSNGQFVSSDRSEGISIYTDTQLGKLVFFGDINGDGSGDAVAVMNDYCGGAGICAEELAVWVNKSGNPQYVTSIGLGYRPSINFLKIQNQIITIDMYPSDTDNLQYPNQPREIISYKLVNNKLVKDQPTDWKIYESSIYDYEIKYPSAYKTSIEKIPTGVSDIDRANYENKDYFIAFEIFARNANFILKNCLKDLSGNSITKIKEINGNKFYAFYEKKQGTGGRMALVLGGIESEYHIIRNNQCYIIRYTMIPADSSLPLPSQTEADFQFEILDQIFSTFKFTK